MTKYIALIAVLTAFAFTQPMHLRLTKSSPEKDVVLEEAPAEIRLWFNQNVHMNVSKIELNHGETAVELPAVEKTDDPKSYRVALPDSLMLQPGEYTVGWVTAGNDEHVIKGTFSFSIGK